MNDYKEKKWYVLRDLKRANAKERAYHLLRSMNNPPLEVYTPMTRRPVTHGGRREYVEVPYICDLLFVYENREVLDPIVNRINTLQYRFVKGGKRNAPMVVRNQDMNSFIAVANSNEKIKYYSPEEITPAMYGRKIKIRGGSLDGMEGRLMTTRGSKVKRLVVELPGILAIAAEVCAEQIQFIE